MMRLQVVGAGTALLTVAQLVATVLGLVIVTAVAGLIAPFAMAWIILDGWRYPR